MKRLWAVVLCVGLAAPIAAVTPAQAADTVRVSTTDLRPDVRPYDLPPEFAPDAPAVARRAMRALPGANQPVWQVGEVPVEEGVGVAGVTWPQGSPPPEVFVRTVVDGEPGEWAPLDAEENPDPNNPTADAGTEPLLVVGASSVQVATMASEPVPAKLQVFASSSSSSSSQLAWSNPDIYSRAAWGANESIVKKPYIYAKVTGAMIHYTAGSNTYSRDDVPAILRSIQAYHVNGRGWKDIGYNFLVDRFGRAWEGRGGGVDKAVEGGHAWGVTNSRVFGISLMGTYDGSVKPPREAIAAVERVIAWKFQLHKVDPLGKTWGSGGKSGGDPTLNAISGHRDESNTLCPGDNVYSQMAQIRQNVKALMEASEPPVSPAIKATGKPKISGSRAYGKTVKASLTDLKWNVSGVTKSYSWLVNGKQVSTSSSYKIRAADAGRPLQLVVTGAKTGHKSGTAKSDVKNISKLTSKTSMTVGAWKAKKAGSVTVKVKVSGLAPSGTVRVYANGKQVASGSLGSDGTAKIKLPARSKGSVKLQAKYLGNSQIKGSNSSTKKVSVK